jgi:hypothetical protein
VSPAVFHLPEELQAEYLQALQGAVTLAFLDPRVIHSLNSSTGQLFVIPVAALSDAPAMLQRLGHSELVMPTRAALVNFDGDSLSLVMDYNSPGEREALIFVQASSFQELTHAGVALAHEFHHVGGDPRGSTTAVQRAENEIRASQATLTSIETLKETLVKGEQLQVQRWQEQLELLAQREQKILRSWQERAEKLATGK